MSAIFVWTFTGVVQAIFLAIVLLFFVLIGSLALWYRFREWLKRRQSKTKGEK